MGSILGSLGSLALSMITSLLAGPVLKRLVISYLEAEAKRYAERAKQTEDTQDDARAAMFSEMVETAKTAWGLK